ncbi:CHAT domain-containing protein [Trichoderma breve]|uniref:CHAT domain-containing protein n=1 Tax=Trichoderma breve TaxID=2034170 RepID=A0A9W9EDG0_9HYPO|nr:CHAT domain-containing protein [Trichoderma breve]KAJ4864665.1 CHAT domain-containing protein [Trichoderma breve]
MVAAAVHGLLDESVTKAAASTTISSLRQALQAMNRLQEASSLLYFEVQLIAIPEEAMHRLQSFLNVLNGDMWDVERALTLAEIFKLQLQSSDDTVRSKAEDTFKEAQELFNKVSHAFGNINLDFTRISFGHTFSTEEKFVQILNLVGKYFEVNHYGQMMLCLTTALSEQVDAYVEQVKYAIELQQQLADEMGSEMIQTAILMRAAGSANLNASEYGFALNALEPQYMNLPEEVDPKSHALLASIMSMIYGSFGNNMEALKAAEESLEIAKSGQSYKACSDAAFILGLRHLSISEQYPRKSAEDIKWLSSAMDILKEWIESDADNGYTDGEVQKCMLVGKWENLRASDDPELKFTPVEKPWIERVKKLLPSQTDVLKRSELLDLEVSMLMRQGNFLESSKLSTDYLNDLDKLPFVPPMIKAQAYSRDAHQAWLCSRAIVGENKTTTAEERLHATTQLLSALDLANKSLQQWRQTSSSELIIRSTLALGSLLSDILSTISEDLERDLLSGFMDELQKTETICDDMRRSVIPIEGLTSLMNKRLLVAKDSSLKIYKLGVRIALRLNDSAQAWTWLQKGKSRAFSDSLGAKLLVPQNLLQRINSDQTACDLLKAEQMHLDALNQPGVNHILVARELTSIRKRVQEYPPLAEIARIRNTTLNLEIDPVCLDMALSRTNLSRERVKFVDWYVPSSKTKENPQIICFVRTLDGTTRTKQLAISVTQVEAWISKAFTYPDMAEHPLNKKTGNRLLQEMNALVDWLTDYSAEGDLLVLSPSGQLNNVPLHALFIERRPLVERNLVVYASSAAVMSQCLDRSASERSCEERNTGETTAFFAVYEEPLHVNERNLIFSHIQTLSTVLPGNVFLGPEVTKSRFIETSSTATWLHYHGHARYCKEDVLQSSLILSNGEDIFDNSNAENLLLGRDELSVVDLFNTTLPQGGVHFTIIACESATQDLSPGDEPLGIIPALLHAGATSVLGCQWPIKSSAGRAFSEAFYDEVRYMRSITIGGNQTVNLAQALGITVGKMRRGELGVQYKQAYCWASIAMHGLWFFPSFNGGT